MAVKGTIDRIKAGGLHDASRNADIAAERAARDLAHESAKASGRLADAFAKRAREQHAAAGGRYAAFRGKPLAPVLARNGMTNANGLQPDTGYDLLNEAYDD